MPFDYAKDNMERRPYEFYIEEYRQADPIEISNRLGIAYDVQKSEFIIFFMGVNYHVSYPDFRVSHEESKMCFYPLEEDIYAKNIGFAVSSERQRVSIQRGFSCVS